MRRLFFLAGFLVLVLVPASNGDGYCRNRQATYYAPAYKTYTPSYAATYTAPSYDYTPVYQTYLKTQLYPMNADYYSSSESYYRDKIMLDAFAGKLSEALKKDREQTEYQQLKEEVLSLRRQLLYGGGQQPMPQSQPQQQYQPQAPPEQTPQQQQQQRMPRANGALPKASAKFKTFVQSNCVRCHGATNATAGNGIDLQDLDACPRELRLMVKASIDDGSMPKGGKAAPDDIAAEAHTWATGRSGTLAAK